MRTKNSCIVEVNLSVSPRFASFLGGVKKRINSLIQNQFSDKWRERQVYRSLKLKGISGKIHICQGNSFVVCLAAAV